MPNAAKTIRSFNAGRDPERLAMKYANLRSSPFVFLLRLPHALQPQASPAASCRTFDASGRYTWLSRG